AEDNQRPLNVYGGVARSVQTLKTDSKDSGRVVTSASPLYASDVALSAVGDTLTLPITVAVAVARGINSYHSEKKPPADESRPWKKDQPTHLIPERIHGGII